MCFAARLALLVAAMLMGLHPLLAQKKAAELLVGQWEPIEQDKIKVVIEFTRDGKLRISIGEKTLRGTYRVFDDANIEVTIEAEGKFQTEKLQVFFSKDQGKDEMTTVDSRGKKDTFRRIK